MNGWSKGKKLAVGCGLGGVALVAALAGGGTSDDLSAPAVPSGAAAAMEAGYDPQGYAGEGMAQAGAPEAAMAQNGDGAGGKRQGEAEQALEGLAQIRKAQCQSGNTLACQALPTIPGIRQQLAQAGGACEAGDRGACATYDTLARRIVTAYSESAAVMRSGEEGMAQMDAWRAGMNRNAAASMANLKAAGAAGQAAHEARQASYAAMNRNWQAGQDSIDRNHGRSIDRIYEGTTMDGGGVQSRVPNGTTGYTDGYGNVIAVPQGERPPDGWQPMKPTYAAPR